MGTYDILTDNMRTYQVKCWDNELKVYNFSDYVPALDGHTSYVVVLPEEGYAWIVDSKFIGVFDEIPLGFPIADKYGDWHTKESIAEFYNSSSDPFSIQSLTQE